MNQQIEHEQTLIHAFLTAYKCRQLDNLSECLSTSVQCSDPLISFNNREDYINFHAQMNSNFTITDLHVFYCDKKMINCADYKFQIYNADNKQYIELKIMTDFIIKDDKITEIKCSYGNLDQAKSALALLNFFENS